MSHLGTPVDDVDRDRRRRALVWLAIAWLVLALAGIAMVFGNRADEPEAGVVETTEASAQQPAPSDPEPSEATPDTTEVTPDTTEAVPDTTEVTPDTTEAVPDTTEVTPDTTEGASGDVTDSTDGAESEAAVLPEDDGPVLVATLADRDFTLRGVVPSEEYAAALTAAADLSYAPYVDASGLEVDPAVGSADWLERAPSVIGLLPMITDGSITFSGGAFTLEGRSPNPEYLDAFRSTVSGIMGADPASVDVTVTDLVPPVFRAQAVDGDLAMEGTVQTEEIREVLIEAGRSAYGADNVRADLEVDPDVYTSFWMYTMPQVFGMFSVLPEYEFSVIDGITAGSVTKGINFGFDSVVLDEGALQAIQVAGALLQRDRSLGLVIEGHTDSIGPSEYNDVLSMSRAEAVKAVLTESGISDQRIVAVGRGESDPVASNDTEEGRAANRRVAFRFDVLSEIGGEG